MRPQDDRFDGAALHGPPHCVAKGETGIVLSINQVQGLKVFLPPEEKRRIKKDGTERAPKRLGKVHAVVFAPGGRRVVGFMVKRPDIAGMVKREDLFLGLDSFETAEGGILCTQGNDSFDDSARKRLRIGDNWDRCIIWGGMDVKTTDGHVLGYVTDVSFSPKTGAVSAFDVSDGTVSTQLVGVVRVPAKMLVGYEGGWMTVKPEAAKIKLSGGLAEKAGTASAKAQYEGKKAGKKAAKATSEVVDKGSYQLGRAIGKAKRAVAAAQGPDEESQLPPVEAQDARVSKTSAGSLPKPVDSEEKRVYAPKTVAKNAKSENNGADKENRAKRPSTKNKSASSDAARKLGKQLGKTKGMFEDFKREFDENSR